MMFESAEEPVHGALFSKHYFRMSVSFESGGCRPLIEFRQTAIYYTVVRVAGLAGRCKCVPFLDIRRYFTSPAGINTFPNIKNNSAAELFATSPAGSSWIKQDAPIFFSNLLTRVNVPPRLNLERPTRSPTQSTIHVKLKCGNYRLFIDRNDVFVPNIAH
jgi:hypothetical protein